MPVGSVNVASKAAEATAPAEAPAPATETNAPVAAEASVEVVAEQAPAAAPAPSAAIADGQAIYNKACLACHMTGVAGAPKLDDKAAWEARVAKGMDALLQSAINGVPGTAMPARGSCGNCSDDDLKAAVEFMVSQ